MNYIEKITVIDAPCGAGKTSFAIQTMLKDLETSYIYCTPFLDEIERIRNACGRFRFHEPRNFGTSKIEDFNRLLAEGKNIAVTHSTFLNATAETAELIRQGEYTMIIDEALDIIGDFNKVASVESAVEQSLKTKDVEVLLRDGLIETGENGIVNWVGGDYLGTKYSEVERLARLGRLYLVNNSILCMFPPEVFQALKKVYVMTYLFEGSFLKYYFDLFGISYEKVTTTETGGKYELVGYTPEGDHAFRQHCRDLISVRTDCRLTDGYKRSNFSKNWYERTIRKPEVQGRLKKDLAYFFRKEKASSKEILWTCPKAYTKQVQGKGYTCVRQLTKDELELPEKERKKKEKELACFVPLNARATNDYKDRWALAYCFNMYSPRMIWHFFNNCEHPVDDDLFAIACLIQWVFRSRIREGEPIVLYLPSPRMRELFNRWLNCEI